MVGPAGVGKTVLARETARRFATRHPRALSHWISATASARHVPFGAFSHLVQMPGASESVALLQSARASLCGESTQPVLIAVDDAHLLDNLSAALVHQLALTSAARLVITARSGEPVPDAITTLWKDAVIRRVDIEPFDRTQTTRLVELALGGPLETASANRIFTMSQGNPLYLRHLVEGAEQAGALRVVDGVWQLRGQTTLTRQLSELIESHLAGMTPAVRDVVDFLSVEEPLPVDVLSQLVSAQAVESAEKSGVVTLSQRGHDLVVHSAHPLYTESVRASMGRMAARRLRTSLVAVLGTRTAEHVSDRLRLAALAIDSDLPPEVPDILTASWQAMQLGDLALGERLARGALSRSDGLPARLALAHSLSWQGRGRETDEALAPVDHTGLSEWELTAWTLPKAANQFWMLKDSERAVEFLQTMRARVTLPAPLQTIDALAATFAMNSGDPRRSIDVATTVLESTDADDLAIAWASSAAAISCARTGRLADVEGLVQRCLQAQHPGLVRYAAGLGEVQTALVQGQIDTAEESARHYLGFADFEQPGRAIGEVILGQVLIAKGDLGGAIGVLRQAGAALRQTGYSWGPMGLSHLAKALGQRGDAAGAQEVLLKAEESHGMRSAIYTPELNLARAWTRASAGDVRGAVAAARDAVAYAVRTGQRAQALLAHHDAVRLGDTQAVTGVGRIVAELDCGLGPIVLRHAQGVATRDGSLLDSVSADLALIGMNCAAADAVAQAAVAFELSGDRKRALGARARTAELRRLAGGAKTPALEAVLNPLPLSGRQREVALMVAAGLSNKAIAEKLTISVRTVETHVYHACTKLDVADRTMLAHAVEAASGGGD